MREFKRNQLHAGHSIWRTVPCSTPRFHRGGMFRLKERSLLNFETYNSHFNEYFEILCENRLKQYTE